ncbi:MAG TPA: hypothetical protein VHT73_19880 [Thermodesulfobacteriota bacterium]|nr:hypothetical protein [Thermodesulfobacteriota bacterium]
MKAQIVEKGLIDCFEDGLCTPDGKPVHAEISAVVYDGVKLIFGSDKPVPGNWRSDVFSIIYNENGIQPGTIKYYTASPIKIAAKFEDFALTPDRKYVIATTGFDRIKSDSAEFDTYNTLLVWPLDKPNAAKIVSPSTRGGVTSSTTLRKNISEALNGAPYFKIEGLTAIEGNEKGKDGRLLIGVREVGTSHEDFEYVVQVISVPYKIENDELVFTEDFELIYNYDPGEQDEITRAIGLSSIEYDLYANRMFLLTSFEEKDASRKKILGGYLLVLSMEDFNAGNPPTLVANQDGMPLEFADKSEGIAVLSEKRAFIVFDNDRILDIDGGKNGDSRKPNQAPYAILEFEN